MNHGETTTGDEAAHGRAHHDRIQSIDIVRGLVMVLMVLDHVRDFVSNVGGDPAMAEHPQPVLFFLRWVTHFCAPTFLFLAGTGAYFYRRKTSPRQLSHFLWTRGLWLVVLEILVVRQGWTFSVSKDVGLILQVIWAIGISMLLSAAVLRLPLRVVAVAGLLIVALHNSLDGIAPASLGVAEPFFRLLHVRGSIEVFGLRVIVLYPLVPWVAVMWLGFAAGRLFEAERMARANRLLVLGALATFGFVVLRSLNFYGDPHPWKYEGSIGVALMKALATEKYPPSLHYLLMTLGPMLLLLGVLERWPRLTFPRLLTFGKVPLFLYIVHIYLVHVLAVLFGSLSGYPPQSFLAPFFTFPKGYGFGPLGVLLCWMGVVVSLYPACRYYAHIKKTRNSVLLSYL
jgi:uncharacterized membrane protein